MSYEPKLPPDIADTRAFLQYLLAELRNVSTAPFTLVPQYAPPNPIINYQMVFADGTSWNPGSGRGVYVYDPVTPGWRFLG